MNKATVAIDAGHGPAKPKAYIPGVDEQAVNWILATRIELGLQDHGITVIRTRPDYWLTPGLAQRVATANQARADFFLSIHLNDLKDKNGNPDPRPKGTEVYHYGPSTAGAAAAKIMAQALQAGTGRKRVKIVASPSPDYPTTLYVLKNTRMPALLLEAAYITNPEEGRLFTGPAFPAAFVESTVRGTVAALRELGR